MVRAPPPLPAPRRRVPPREDGAPARFGGGSERGKYQAPRSRSLGGGNPGRHPLHPLQLTLLFQ